MGGYKADTEFERFVKCYNKTGMPWNLNGIRINKLMQIWILLLKLAKTVTVHIWLVLMLLL